MYVFIHLKIIYLRGCGFICVAAVGEPVTWLQLASSGWDQPKLSSPCPWYGGPDPRRSAGHLTLGSFSAYTLLGFLRPQRSQGNWTFRGVWLLTEGAEVACTTTSESTISQSTALLLSQCLFHKVHTNTNITKQRGKPNSSFVN